MILCISVVISFYMARVCGHNATYYVSKVSRESLDDAGWYVIYWVGLRLAFLITGFYVLLEWLQF